MAGVKYHISPDTGRPNICRATTKACPVGGAHFDSKEAARAGYEKAMSKETFSPAKKKKKTGAKVATEAVKAQEEAEKIEEDSWSEGDYDFDPASDSYFGEPPAEELDDVSIDDDFSDIKCDDCGLTLSSCSCGECEYCGVPEGDDHEEDCPRYKPVRKAYSWD